MTGSPPTGIAQLDELEILVVVDNETDTLSSIDEGVPQIPEAVGLAARTPPSGRHGGHDCKVVFDRLCCACHGFSVLIRGRLDGVKHAMLFDVGPYPSIWLENADRLELDLSSIELLFLSHWHFDHSGGFPEVISAIAKARSEDGRPPPVVDVHPDRPDQRGLLTPNGELLMLPEEPGFDALREAGGEVVTHAGPHPICDGFFFGSGKIERVTDYETGLAGHYSIRGSEAAPDPLIMEERYVAACVKGRGVSVFSACSHAGVVNVCLAVSQEFGGMPVDIVVGGYHLAGKAMEPRIEPTIRDLEQRVAPRIVAPGHCTGWRAKARLAQSFAPGRYGPSVVGTMYRLN